MVGAKLIDPERGSDERKPVRGEDDRLRWKAGESGERVEKPRQRIGVRLDRRHADVRADRRQQHVPRDAYTQVFAEKSGMLGRMTVAVENAPAEFPDGNLRTRHQALIDARQLGNAAPV